MFSFIVPQKINSFYKSLENLIFNSKQYEDLHKEFKFYFKSIYINSDIYFTGAGRVSIYYALKVFKSVNPAKKEVIVTSFTCASVIDSILKCDLIPVYVDFSLKTFGTEPNSVKKNISKKTLAIIAQHTFGIPCEIESIKKIISNKNIFLIEDCAISFKSNLNNKIIGSYGDVSIFSFDHSKPINLLMGGAIVCNNLNLKNNFKLELQQRSKPSFFYEISLIFYMIFDYLTYLFENKNYQQFIRIIYAILKKIKIIGNPLLKKFYLGEKKFNNHEMISLTSLTIFKTEKNRILNLLEIRKINYIKILSFIKKNRKKLKFSHPFNFISNIYPLRIILIINNENKNFFKKFFDSKFYWFKEPIIAREEDFEFYQYKKLNNRKYLKVFSGVVNISLNLTRKELKYFLTDLQNLLDDE